MDNSLRHYANMRGEEVVIMGHNPGINQMMVCRVNALPGDDQIGLRNIASSPGAQSMDYLIPLLQKEHHRSGIDWCAYLFRQINGNRGAVMSVPMKDISDMQPDQLAYFKGYGNSAQGIADKNKTSTVAEPPLADVDMPVMATEEPTPLAPAINDTVLTTLNQLSEGMSSIMDRLEQLEKRPVKATSRSPGRKKPGPKPGAKKAKALAQAEEALQSHNYGE